MLHVSRARHLEEDQDAGGDHEDVEAARKCCLRCGSLPKYFRGYTIGKALGDVTLIRPLLTLGPWAVKRLAKSKVAMAAIVLIAVAAIITAVTLYIVYQSQLEAAFAAVMAVILPAIAVIFGAVVRIREYLGKCAPGRKFCVQS